MRKELLRPTSSEIKAICAIARYGTIAAAARALRISPHKVDWHLDRLRIKTGQRYLPQLVAWAASNGWLEGACLSSQLTVESMGMYQGNMASTNSHLNGRT
jgi:DNA-binding CsgD family transcriptional regulator